MITCQQNHEKSEKRDEEEVLFVRKKKYFFYNPSHQQLTHNNNSTEIAKDMFTNSHTYYLKCYLVNNEQVRRTYVRNLILYNNPT